MKHYLCSSLAAKTQIFRVTKTLGVPTLCKGKTTLKSSLCSVPSIKWKQMFVKCSRKRKILRKISRNPSCLLLLLQLIPDMLCLGRSLLLSQLRFGRGTNAKPALPSSLTQLGNFPFLRALLCLHHLQEQQSSPTAQHHNPPSTSTLLSVLPHPTTLSFVNRLQNTEEMAF